MNEGAVWLVIAGFTMLHVVSIAIMWVWVARARPVTSEPAKRISAALPGGGYQPLSDPKPLPGMAQQGGTGSASPRQAVLPLRELYGPHEVSLRAVLKMHEACLALQTYENHRNECGACDDDGPCLEANDLWTTALDLNRTALTWAAGKEV